MEKRFKILYLLAQEISEVLTDNLEELALKIENNDPQAEKVLSYYENQIIRILEN